MRPAALAVLLLALCAGRAPAQSIHEGGVAVILSENYAAVTTCILTPLTWLRHDIRPAFLASILEHETAHREHMAEFPSCAAFYAWRDESWENQIETEARAFCAGAKWDIAHNTHGGWWTSYVRHAQNFARYWDDPAWGVTAALEAMLNRCRPA